MTEFTQFKLLAVSFDKNNLSPVDNSTSLSCNRGSCHFRDDERRQQTPHFIEHNCNLNSYPVKTRQYEAFRISNAV